MSASSSRWKPAASTDKTSLYFAFLRRPLQAWEYINAASTRCLLLLSYQSDSGDGADQPTHKSNDDAQPIEYVR